MVTFTPPDSNDCLTRIVLDGAEYLFRFSYNYMGGYWTVGVYQGASKPVIAGIKIVPNYPINWHLRQYTELPNGTLGVICKQDKIGRNDFINGNAQMVYVTKDETDEYTKVFTGLAEDG